MKEEIKDTIIIGGGPAGITAGIYLARKNLDVLLLTKEFGGQLSKKALAIENYPGFEEISGAELIEKFKRHLEKFKVKVILTEVVKVEKEKDIFKVFTKEKKEFFSKSLIVASGCNLRRLNIPGEKEYIGKGVSFCAICDAPFFKHKRVAVIGGGNSGLETAIYMKNIAEKVYLLEASQKLKGDEILQERIKEAENIEILTSCLIKEIKGEDFVKSIIVEKDGEIKEIPLDGVFIAIGLIPATSFLENLVDFTERGEIKIDPESCATKTPGLFAAGDVTNIKYKQIVIAAGEGAKAALSCYFFLENLIKSS